MKILVNGTPLLAPLTGIGQYIRHLFTAMAQIPQADVYMYYGLRCEKGMRLPSAGTARAVQRSYGLLRRLLPRPRALRRLAEQAMFRYHSRSGWGDTLYHEPNYVPLPHDGPLVLTVCDLSCFDHPETHPLERVRLMQRDMPAAIERADHIIVISEATGAALQRWFNVDPARVSNTYLAADPRFQPLAPAATLPILSGLDLSPGAYVLCVGTLEPRKNLATLFAAYAGLPAALRQRFPLLVAGMSGWNTEGLMKSMAELLRRNELRLLGYVRDEALPALYAGAAAFCYPSRYEGFGLPALEAMASGVPVITSNRTSLPEVVGDAGLMLDPDDVDGMRESLRRLLEDRDFAENLGQRGLERSRMFSWERCARETFAVYEQVMSGRGRRP
jgi:glycosyltransferase involved in cell wall biosynthesis